MSYGTGPAPYGDQAPYGGPAPYPGGPTPYGAPSQFGQFGPPPLTPDIAPQPGASFGEAVKRFFQRYAQFSGYASRSEYWWVVLFNSLVGLGIYVLLFMVVGLGGALGGSSDDVGTSMGIGAIIVVLLAFAYAIATFIPGLALTVRRLHDVGKPWNMVVHSAHSVRRRHRLVPDPDGIRVPPRPLPSRVELSKVS